MFLHSIKKLVLFHDILLIVKREGEREKKNNRFPFPRAAKGSPSHCLVLTYFQGNLNQICTLCCKQIKEGFFHCVFVFNKGRIRFVK